MTIEADEFPKSANARSDGMVDVIIAAWNRADTIERAVLSALAEPEVARVIVVDDASTDDTAGRAASVEGGAERVIVIRQNVNTGPAAARNKALEAAKSPWVAILDGDDYFEPGRIARLLAYSSEQDFIADDLLQIPEGGIGHDKPKPMLSERPFEPWRCDFETFVLGNVSRPGRNRKELGFFKPLIRRSFIEEHRLRYEEDLRLGEDYALYAKALALGARFLITPALGYVSVLRAGSLSGRHSKQDLERLRESDRRLEGLPNLSAAERRALSKHYRSVDARVQWLEVIEAVKQRNPKRFVTPFFRSSDVSRFLAARLTEQARIRLLKRAKESFR